jgi:hypothetical protein
MLLAGGTLVAATAVVGCNGQTQASVFAGDRSQGDAGTGGDATSMDHADGADEADAGSGPVVSGGCCNANPDPCCFLECGEDASAYASCDEDDIACEFRGGRFTPAYGGDAGGEVCVPGLQAGLCGDAAAPCDCLSTGYYSSPQASARCLKDQATCEGQGGTFTLDLAWDGGESCALPAEAGPFDAGPDTSF